MFKSYKNAFYSKCLYIICIWWWGSGVISESNKGDIEVRIAIYNKFIDLYALYYKKEEFIISINMENEALLSWKHEKMHINKSFITNKFGNRN